MQLSMTSKGHAGEKGGPAGDLLIAIEEIEHAVKLLRSENVKKLTILHCSSAYPTPFDEANLSSAIWIDGKKCALGSIGVCN